MVKGKVCQGKRESNFQSEWEAELNVSRFLSSSWGNDLTSSISFWAD